MPPASASAAQNHNSIGDLVPMHQKLLSQPAVNKFLDKLMQQLLKQGTAPSSTGWEVLDAPLMDGDHLALNAPAHTCVVQLAGNPATVGVFKVARNGDCTLFVRMNRGHLDAWCAINSAPKNRRRIFRRVLTPQQASTLMGRAQAFRLKSWEVHHPQALMVICQMALAKWIVPPKEAQRIPSECGSFTLVAVPPADQNFEQCLTLLGHKSTFALATGDEGADNSDGEDTPLSSLVLPEDVWGPIVHGKTICSEWVGKFTNATRVFRNYADTKTLTKCVPAINAHAEWASVALDTMRELFARDAKKPVEPVQPTLVAPKEATKTVPPVPLLGPSPNKPKIAQKGLKPSAEQEGDNEDEVAPAGKPKVPLAPSDTSDDEEEEEAEAEAEAEVAPAPAPAPATGAPATAAAATAAASSSGTAGRRAVGTSPGQAGKKRGRGRRNAGSEDDDDDDDDDDEDDSSSSVASTDSEKESDDDDDDDEGDTGDTGDTFASGVATSDEEQGEEEEEEQGKQEEEEEESPPARSQAKKKKKKRTAAVLAEEDEIMGGATRAFAAELAAKDEALRANMHEIAAQSYEHVMAWQRGERGPPMTKESAYQVGQDLGEIQQAKSPMALVAAMSNLVKTLTNAHHEHFKGETCEVPTAHEQRLRAACNQAVQFSEATMGRLDKAIKELTEARAMGHEVLQQIAAPSAGASAPSSSTA